MVKVICNWKFYKNSSLPVLLSSLSRTWWCCQLFMPPFPSTKKQHIRAKWWWVLGSSMGRTWSPGLPTDWLYKTWENCLTLCLLISMKVEREEIIIQYLFPRVALGIGIKSVQYQDRETPNKQNLICVSQQYSGSLTSTLTLCPGPLLHIKTSLWK